MSTGQPDQPARDPEETSMDTENLPNANPNLTDQGQDRGQDDGGDAPTPADFDADAGELLLNEVREALTRFVILPDEHAATRVVLWIAATHAVPAWAHAARLVIRAPEKRCGKSRLLDLVEATCHDPLLTVNASPSAVYRSIGMKRKNPPTILLDEADTIFGPKAGDNEDLRGLLNAGHQRNRPALRYNAATSSVEKIQTFAMAAMAGIGAMPDTIEDRAVVIRMRRRAPGESVAPLRTRRDGPALDNLRQRLNQWVRAHLDHLGSAMPDMPVEDRAADTWEPLLAVADLAGGVWPDLARAACLKLTETRDANVELSIQARLLTDCRAAFGTSEMLATTDLLDHLKDDPEAPWATYGNTGLTPVRLGALLRDFDIKSSNLRLGKDEAGNDRQAKGYRRADFTDAWARYCPPEVPNPSQPSQPSQGDVSADQSLFPSGTAREIQPSQSRPTHTQAVPAVPHPSHPKTAPDQPKYLAETAGTAGTAGTAPLPLTCHACHQPMAVDDGTHVHPTCEEISR